MSTVKKVAALAAGAAALTVGGAWYAYRTAFQADPKRIAPVRSIPEGEEYAPHRELILRNIDDLLARPFERVSVTSHDGLRLVGKYYAGRPGAPLLLFFHGYRSTAERDGSGGFQFCLENGFSVLLADQRGHGTVRGRPSPSASGSGGTAWPGPGMPPAVLTYPCSSGASPWEPPRC